MAVLVKVIGLFLALCSLQWHADAYSLILVDFSFPLSFLSASSDLPPLSYFAITL